MKDGDPHPTLVGIHQPFTLAQSLTTFFFIILTKLIFLKPKINKKCSGEEKQKESMCFRIYVQRECFILLVRKSHFMSSYSVATGPAREPAIVWARVDSSAVRPCHAAPLHSFPFRTSYLLILSSTAVVGRIRAQVLCMMSSQGYFQLFLELFLTRNSWKTK